ncbi:MAG TPA: MltA domain-containing protein, partial [Burkholderiales bacterium]|nr:MltA domain-containing protein [Burkholderiales bacterium]
MPYLFFLLFLVLGGCCTVPKPAPRPVPEPVGWSELPGWQKENPLPSLEIFRKSCSILKKRPSWTSACAAAESLDHPDASSARAFFERNFRPYRLVNADGSKEGLITGYFEPIIRGSLKPSSRYRYPVYGVPKDLITVDLGDVYPELRHMRLRGRIEGRKLVPYYSRKEIDSESSPLRGNEILWGD